MKPKQVCRHCKKPIKPCHCGLSGCERYIHTHSKFLLCDTQAEPAPEDE